MSKLDAQFVFMTCRAGAEGALKQEVARAMPAWRPAYSRPGFVTYKCGEESAVSDRSLAAQHWTFAYTCGISLGKLVGEQLADMATQAWELMAPVVVAHPKTPVDLHVWQREAATDESGDEVFVTDLCLEIEAALRAAAPESANLNREMTSPRRAAQRDSIVFDIVISQPGEWWVGYHRAVRRTERWPGGVIPIRTPDFAVSRAFTKLEEALQWSDLPLAAEDECVEVGCAPGGASQALLARGLFVTGIDPADVDTSLKEHPRFRHLKKRGSDVRRHEFAGVRWLAADMNIAPEDTLTEIESIVTSPQVSIRGLVLTLKFSDWSVANRIPEFIERVRGWGYRDVRVRQLVSGGQEVCLVALRRKALRRLGRKRRPAKAGTSGRQTREDGPHTPASEPHF
ncbi:MAG TPA: SAM-dependent methyltransferase [Lacipirellulaceae bacterium]|jgi:23S rRNA (cytidine2498-2'-O)-methyltransferase|nr:SAM-dependent methyltransferase [Lacipirellulaceae bacterium]